MAQVEMRKISNASYIKLNKKKEKVQLWIAIERWVLRVKLEKPTDTQGGCFGARGREKERK